MVTKTCQVCIMYWHLHLLSNVFAYMPGFEPDSWTIKILSSSPSKFNISLLWNFPPWLCIWKHVNFTTSKKKKTWIHEILNHIPNVVFSFFFRKLVARCHPNSSFFMGLFGLHLSRSSHDLMHSTATLPCPSHRPKS